MDEELIPRVSHEVIKFKRCSTVPAVLAVPSPVSSSPIVASEAIVRGVLLVHVVSETLHGVAVQNVSEGEGVAQLSSMREVPAVVPALGPVHHQSVRSNVCSVSALSVPVCGG